MLKPAADEDMAWGGDGPWWRGRFFPNDCDGGPPGYDLIDGRIVLRVRHLPAARDVLEARVRFGPAAEPLLTRWRALWDEACGEGGVDGFAAGTLVAMDAVAGMRGALAREAREHLATGNLRRAAGSLLRSLGRDDVGLVRERHFHVMEDAVTHVELVAAGMRCTLLVPLAGGGMASFAGDGGTLRRLDPGDGLARDARKALTASETASTPYWEVPAFRERAGRPMALTSDRSHLAMTLLDMSAQGHAKAFLKSSMCKRGTWVVDIEGVDDVATMQGRISQAMGGSVGDLSSGHSWTATMLVQGFVPFVREHRFMLVGHRVVASTASDRKLSVLDADVVRILHGAVARLHGPAEAAGAYDRGTSDTEADRELVARMALGARDLGRALRGHWADAALRGPTPDCYVIDMGEAPDGRVLPIEINTISFCGLYAAGYRRVARALARRDSALAEAWNRRQAAAMAAAMEESEGLAWMGIGTDPGPPVLPASGRRPEVPLSDAGREGIVRAWLAAKPWADRVAECADFSTRHHDEISAYAKARDPRITGVGLARETSLFPAWEHPEWVGRWEAHLRACAGCVVEDAVRRLSRVGRDAGLATVFRYGPVGEAGPEGLLSDEPGGWRSGPRTTLGARGGAGRGSLRAMTDWGSVDWPASILSHALNEEEGSFVTLLPGALVRVVAARRWPGGGDGMPEDVPALVGRVLTIRRDAWP